MRKQAIILIIAFFTFISTNAQESFPEKCTGIWEGNTYLYSNGILKDSLSSQLIISPIDTADGFVWKTTYFLEKEPVIKDYSIKLVHPDSNRYIIDEQNGIALNCYLFNNKLYAVFETEGQLLTSTYELVNADTLIFEVTVGKALDRNKPVNNYNVNNLQRTIFRKTN